VPLPNVNFTAGRQPNIRRCKNKRAKRHSLADPTHQVGQRIRFIGVFCVHRLPLSAVKFFLPCFPEVRADPNIVIEPGHDGFGGLVPYVNLSAGWY
jgi:hypothetical protein